MCLYPRLIRNPKYKENKKNNGVIPQCNDSRQKLVPVGCGKCMECSKAKAMEWKIRLTEEIKEWQKGAKHFITLTFSEESLKELRNEIKDKEGYELDNAVATLAVRRFLERWRKTNKKSVKHWLVTELGQTSTERIHIHGIIFTAKKEEIDKTWKYGNTWIGQYVNETTVGYIVKYIFKTDPKHKEYKPIILTSAGIGATYMTGYNAMRNKYREDGETRDYYITREGHKLALPIYYRNKIYTDEEREKLWTEKLDKETRYVDKQKIKNEQGIKVYIKARAQARVKNKRLGYGGRNSEKEDKDYNEKIIELRKHKYPERSTWNRKD